MSGKFISLPGTDIRQVPRANVLQGCCEEFSLLRRDDIRNDNDHACVERFFAVQIKEVGAIVGDERVLFLADDSHKLPIFKPAESTVTDMACAVARRMGDSDKRCVKAFIDQELHVDLASSNLLGCQITRLLSLPSSPEWSTTAADPPRVEAC